MKKFLLIFLVTMLASAGSLKSQNYYPFPTDLANWNQYYWWNGAPTGQWGVNYQYIMEGDTVLGGKSYNKLYYKATDSPSASVFIGGLREDSLRQIYFFPDSSLQETGSPGTLTDYTTEHLLYTFNNLHAGDTLQIHQGVALIKVIAIDSVMIGTSYRKRYEIQNSNLLFYPEYWIEGIGSTKDLLSPFLYEFEWNLFTLCFSDTATYYINSPTGADSCHWDMTGLNEYNDEKIKIIAFPNPFRDFINIEVEDQTSSAAEVTICDMTGRTMLFTILQPNETIDLRNLSAGAYLLKIRSDQQTGTSILIKE
ncbi:MAG: hypothetical protein A2W93_00955 [Bacteroidetes bacterium GWF2_43_63]|nr:MAG: hypothetical protein A2W94_14980 [Bacteroidetes bacterium GWE2_42_42]OFY54161.1 MAG: hypothetical protein A2W93_00955 [Bacteroidetes bacterium GWF2_43_63]HBG70799.1 hypothetical protein [Bacteroidales bacterium]HCB61703.1 hypothetical protein [Bacteroidales bacterium]HCY22079.1 hypothetical protein [Bacteroidales bacterium]